MNNVPKLVHDTQAHRLNPFMICTGVNPETLPYNIINKPRSIVILAFIKIKPRFIDFPKSDISQF